MEFKHVFLALGVAAICSPSLALADSGSEGKRSIQKAAKLEKRIPLKPAQLRGSTFDLDRYHSQMEVVRVRTAGKDFATFVSEPKLLDPGAVMVFEIRSVAKTGSVRRWKCVAQNDVAECLGKPVRIRYLPADDKVVLVAKLKPVRAVGPKTAVAKK